MARRIFWIIATVLVLSFAGFIHWLWGDNIWRGLITGSRESHVFGFVTVITLAVAAGILWYGHKKNTGYYNGSRFARGTMFAAIGVLVAGVGVFTYLLFANPYFIAKNYVASSETVNAPLPDFAERTPYEVAVSAAKQNLQDTTGEANSTKSVADKGQNGQWNTLVSTRGPFAGYDSVQTVNTPLFGTVSGSDVELCDFNPDVKLRHSGAMPHNNLARAIYQRTPLNVTFDANDSYGLCADEVPYVVVPLKQIDGIIFPVWKAFGVAVLNGETGKLSVYTDAEQVASIPGSTYPLSLASAQRTSLAATTNWWEYVTGVSGYANANDNTEIQLKQIDGGAISYVTPLTPRGSSSSVVAVSEVQAGFTGTGIMNPLIIHKLPKDNIRQANSSLIDNIFTRYSWMPEFASGETSVFEIVPANDGNWVVSIGRSQSVNYHAYISPTGEISLYNRDGDLIAQGVGNGSDDSGSGTGTEVEFNSNLSDMTDEELAELGKDIFDELARRQG